MAISTITVARFRMPAFGAAGWLSATTCAMTAHTAVASAYKPSLGARNDVQGGAGAWSPPV